MSNAGKFGDKDRRLRFIKNTISGSFQKPWTLPFKTLPLPNNCYGSNRDVWDQQYRVLQHGWQMHAVGSSYDGAYFAYFFTLQPCAIFCLFSQQCSLKPIWATTSLCLRVSVYKATLPNLCFCYQHACNCQSVLNFIFLDNGSWELQNLDDITHKLQYDCHKLFLHYNATFLLLHVV